MISLQPHSNRRRRRDNRRKVPTNTVAHRYIDVTLPVLHPSRHLNIMEVKVLLKTDMDKDKDEP